MGRVTQERIAELEAENAQLRSLLAHHVGEHVAERELLTGANRSGDVRFVAVLFVDLIGSTKKVASMRPAQVVDLLNRFFDIVVEVVERNGGFVNKFIGDEALVIFGAPMYSADAAGDALRAARELQAALADSPEMTAGIGIAAGTVLAGNIGSSNRFEYTVIGQPVNEAARLTELAKKHEARVIASEYTVNFARDDEQKHWEVGELVELRGRGKLTRLAWPRTQS